LEDPFPLLDEAAAKIVESINYKKNDKIMISEVLNKY
tara:strand:- start:393 stop:503 length:111 start_codon:yes stop_codon:yes gene_type:complete